MTSEFHIIWEEMSHFIEWQLTLFHPPVKNIDNKNLKIRLTTSNSMHVTFHTHTHTHTHIYIWTHMHALTLSLLNTHFYWILKCLSRAAVFGYLVNLMWDWFKLMKYNIVSCTSCHHDIKRKEKGHLTTGQFSVIPNISEMLMIVTMNDHSMACQTSWNNLGCTETKSKVHRPYITIVYYKPIFW